MFGEIFALLSSVFWGLNGIFVRKALQDVNPLSGTLFILTVNTLWLVFLVIADGTLSKNLTIGFENVLFLALAGLIQQFMGRTMTYFSVHYIGSSRAYTGTSTRIFFSAILGMIILGEKPTFLVAFGSALMIFGLYVFTTEDIRREGLALSLAAGFMYGLAAIFVKVGIIEESVSLSNLISLLSGVSALFVFSAYKGRVKPEKISPYLFLSGTALFIGTYFYFLSLSTTPVVIAVPLSNLYPIFTTFFSILFIQSLEKIALRTVFGVVLTVLGATLVYFG
ncbi:EamA family transporter [Ferroglobus sp.]|uniref:DMT family transporter n=1 Tax=Ferroglobus sp. TaxID=2614230 RepID=UPI0025BD50CE|nr:EamA family transporter [Ferroglobus sp.]